MGIGRAFILVTVLAAAAAGCAPRHAPSAPVVGAAELTSAEVAAAGRRDAELGHRAALARDNGVKEPVTRRSSGRPGGGFSGYK